MLSWYTCGGVGMRVCWSETPTLVPATWGLRGERGGASSPLGQSQSSFPLRSPFAMLGKGVTE